jgi:hypothetical protein
MAQMAGTFLRLFILTALAFALGGCSSINTWLSSALADDVPQWAGGLPPGTPPRPGTAKYDDYSKKVDGVSVQQARQDDQPAQSNKALSSKADN